MFDYQDGWLACQGLRADKLADQFGSPTYVYDLNLARDRYRRLYAAFAPLAEENGGPGLSLHYALKANSHRALIDLFAVENSDFDIVSGGELSRLIAAGVAPNRAIFAGVGKSVEEIKYALTVENGSGEIPGVYAFNVESPAEARRINEIAGRLRDSRDGAPADIALRINPNVDAQTHKFITTGLKGNKFGMDFESAREIIAALPEKYPNLRLRGFHAHIGSQIMRSDRHPESLASIQQYVSELRAENLIPDFRFLNLGGGFGIGYEPEAIELNIEEVADAIIPVMKELGLALFLEPGRYIIGPAGSLIMKVEYEKLSHGTRFIIVDGSMCELIRPSLYSAYHKILPTKEATAEAEWKKTDIVGPVCESTDFLAKERELPPIDEGDLLVAFDAGAYCSVMFSNYNSRPYPAEVAILDGKAHLITERENIAAIFARERSTRNS